MLGAVLHSPGDIRVERRDDPKIARSTDAVIRLVATCVCGSDLWPFRGIEPVDGPAPRLEQTRGTHRARLARDAYSYLHLPMVAGIVLFAFGLKASLPDASHPLKTIPLVGLIGGMVLYFAAHVVLRLRIGGGFGRGRPVGCGSPDNALSRRATPSRPRRAWDGCGGVRGVDHL